MVASRSAGTLLRIYPSSQREEGWSAAGTRGKYNSGGRKKGFERQTFALADTR